MNTNLLNLLLDLAQQFLSAVPNILGALLVFFIGYLIAKLAGKGITKLLASIGLDKLTEKINEIDLVSKANFNFKASKFLGKIIYYVILLIFAMAATEVLGMPAVSKLVSDMINYVPNIISALIVLVVGILLADFIKSIVTTACKSLGIPSSNIIGSFVFYFIFLTVAVTALGQANFETDFIRTNLTVILGGIVGAFAIGYGLASKELLSNFLASFYSKQKVGMGQIIELDGVKGKIIDMDNTTITLETEEKVIIFPMSKLASEKVEIFK